MSPPLARRNLRSASSASAFSGRPDRPPASLAWRDLSGGRETVVFETMIAAISMVDRSPDDPLGIAFADVGRDLQENRLVDRRRLNCGKQFLERAFVLKLAQAPACWAS